MDRHGRSHPEGRGPQHAGGLEQDRPGFVHADAVAYRGLLYVLANNGVFDANELATGKESYRQSLPLVGSGYSASPMAGKIYLANEDGEMLVVEAGPALRVTATNSMGEPLMATPALSEGVMYVRALSTKFATGSR